MANEEIIEEITNKKSPLEAEQNIVGLFTIVYSGIIKKVKESYGEDGVNLVKKAFIDSILDSMKPGVSKAESHDLDTWKKTLVPGLGVGHDGGVVEQNEKHLRFKFTGCPWTIFRDLGMPEIGHIFCDADEPMVKTFNPEIEFERTKTLMDGDDCCNHHYYFK